MKIKLLKNEGVNNPLCPHFSIIILISILTFLNSSCKSGDKEFDISAITPKEKNLHIDLSDYVLDADFIPLDSTAYLKRLHHLVVNKNSSLFAKSYGVAFILNFDKSGKLIDRIKPTGTGPNEFSEVSSLSKGCKENELLIVDESLNKIVIYDVEVKQVNYEIKLDHTPYNAICDGNYIYYLSNDIGDGLVKKLNLNNKLIEQSYLFGPDFANFVKSIKPFYYDGRNNFVGVGLSDTIYKIQEGTINPFRIISNDQGIPLYKSIPSFPDFRNQFLSQSYSEHILEVNVPRDDHIKIGKLMIIPVFSPASDMSSIFYNLESNRSIKLKTSQVENFHLFFRFFFQALEFDGEFLYTSFILNNRFYEDAREYIKNHENNISKKLRKLIMEFPENRNYQNPIIVKIKFNKTVENIPNI